MADLIDRQAAIEAVRNCKILDVKNLLIDKAEAMTNLMMLPSAQLSLYGYKIEHLALIARVMQKENVTPEKAIECFKDIGRIVQMIADEQQEMIKRAVEKWTV